MAITRQYANFVRKLRRQIYICYVNVREIVKGHLEKYMSKTQYAVMMDLWNVDELGKVNHWVSDTSINLEVAVNDPTLLQLRVLIDKQNGVDNHMYGITSTEWRVFLENSLEIPPTIALKFQTDLHKCTQIAIHTLWKARNTVLSTWEDNSFRVVGTSDF